MNCWPPGGSWQRLCGPFTETDVTGGFSCNWNTASVSDGSYKLRAKVIDGSSDGGNTGYTPVVSTFVDNHDPSLSASGGLRAKANGLPIFEDESPPLDVSAGDAGGSGVRAIELFVDGLKRAGVEQDCHGCGMNGGFLFDPTQLETGTHEVKVLVTDRAGRTGETSWAVRVWRNPPDTPDESDADSLDDDGGASTATAASTSSVTEGLGSTARAAVEPNVVESEGGSALGQLPPLECDADDPYVVNDHLDYPAPSELGLPIGSTAPDVAVAAYLLGAANLPPIPPTVFHEEVATDLERFYSVQIDGRRRAWVLLGRTPTGGWQGNYFGACSEFVDTYFWATTLPEVAP